MDQYPLTRIKELIDQAGGSQFFSKIDLHSGFHQIPLDHDFAPKTAFLTKCGSCQYFVMPFGFCVSGKLLIWVALAGSVTVSPVLVTTGGTGRTAGVSFLKAMVVVSLFPDVWRCFHYCGVTAHAGIAVG